jgi:hypothetical protein
MRQSFHEYAETLLLRQGLLRTKIAKAWRHKRDVREESVRGCKKLAVYDFVLSLMKSLDAAKLQPRFAGRAGCWRGGAPRCEQ